MPSIPFKRILGARPVRVASFFTRASDSRGISITIRMWILRIHHLKNIYSLCILYNTYWYMYCEEFSTSAFLMINVLLKIQKILSINQPTLKFQMLETNKPSKSRMYQRVAITKGEGGGSGGLVSQERRRQSFSISFTYFSTCTEFLKLILTFITL
jgi:hypothetical protein